MTSPTDPGPCRDYDPMFKLHGCELDAGHEGPHRDFTGYEWDEHLPDEPGRCVSHAPWGSGYRDQRCTLDSGHRGPHRDMSGNEWDNEADAPVGNPVANPQLRAALIAGLRDLADFIEANPAVPVPSYVSARISIPAPGADDDEKRAFVDSAAAALGTTAAYAAPSGHYTTGRTFGPVGFEVFMIPAAAHARHDALDSYRHSIRLDDAPVAA